MKRILSATLLCIASAFAFAQTFPVQNLQVNGTSSFSGTMSGAGLASHDAGVNHVQTVLNVAALRTTSCVPGLVYATQGYSTIADGGQGTYVCNGADTTTPDNGGTFIAAANSFRLDLQYGSFINAKQFGAKLDGTTDDTTPVQNALTWLNTKGLTLVFNGASMKIGSTLSLNNLQNFVLDFGHCAVSFTGGTGTYLFNGQQAAYITFEGGQFTGNSNLNHFIFTGGSAAALATLYPSIPSESQWAHNLRFLGNMIIGFNKVFDLQTFSREIWIDNEYVTQNIIASNLYGKVVNLYMTDDIMYSSLASSQSMVIRGDPNDTAYRYTEGPTIKNMVAQCVAVCIDMQDFYDVTFYGGQIYSTTVGGAGLSITKGVTNFATDFFFNDILWNSGAVVGVGLASQFRFDGKLSGVFQAINGTAVNVGANVNGLDVSGQFVQATGTPVAINIGANSTNIRFNPAAVESSYTTIAAIDPTSVSGVRATFGGTFLPGFAFGGASVGNTYAQQIGRYAWQGNTITYFTQTQLSAKGSSTGAATITGLPFVCPNPAAGQVSDYNGMSAGVTPIVGIPSGGQVFTLKTSGGGTSVAMNDTYFSSSSTIVAGGTCILGL